MSLPSFTQAGGSANSEVSAIATEAMVAGNIYLWDDRYLFIDGNQNYAIGDLFNGKDNLNLRNQLEDTALTAASVAVGASIYLESATQKIKLASGTGIVGPIGEAIEAKAAGKKQIVFRLNKTANNLT